MVRKKRITKLAKLSAHEKFLKILELNRIHEDSVRHWTETRDGQILMQSMFDNTVREFSGYDGRYVKDIGVQNFFKGFI